MARRLLLAVAVQVASVRRSLASVLVWGALEVATAAASEPRLRPSAGFAPDGDVVAVAVSPDGTTVAAADERGVWVRREGGWQRSALRAPIRDLAFDGQGTLWIGSEGGLFRLDPTGRLEARSIGAGARDRRIARVAASGGLVAAAGEGGAFASLDGARWEPVRDGLPAGPPSALTVRAPGLDGVPFELWLSVESELYRVSVRPTEGAPFLAPAERVEIAGPGARQPALDLAPLGPDGKLVALGSDWLAAEVPGSVWPSERLALPPGSEARRMVAFEGLVWIATDRGLVVAEGVGGPFRRASEPGGRAVVHGLAAAGGTLWAGSEEGLLEAGGPRAAAASAPGRAAFSRAFAHEPSVLAVQRAALAWLDLGPERIRSLRRRLDRRGWMPQVDLRAVGGLERDRIKDFDEAFTGGQFFRFFDQGLDRHSDLAVTFALTWDLGDAVFHPDAIDLSQEAREVVELRDDILDEITQLYFERRRVLAALAALPPAAGDEDLRLRLRADELAAGLDAWTGGWWSHVVAPLSLADSRPDTQE